MTDIDALVAAAEAVRERAYAPYSRHKVGAAVRAEDGRLYVGANVENASYPEGTCAEAAALAAMIAGGGRRVAALALVVAGDTPAPPCGGCCQRIAEFAAPSTEIHLCATGGARRTVRLADILPMAFGAGNLPP